MASPAADRPSSASDDSITAESLAAMFRKWKARIEELNDTFCRKPSLPTIPEEVPEPAEGSPIQSETTGITARSDSGEDMTEAEMEECRARLRALESSEDHPPTDSHRPVDSHQSLHSHHPPAHSSHLLDFHHPVDFHQPVETRQTVVSHQSLQPHHHPVDSHHPGDSHKSSEPDHCSVDSHYPLDSHQPFDSEQLVDTHHAADFHHPVDPHHQPDPHHQADSHHTVHSHHLPDSRHRVSHHHLIDPHRSVDSHQSLNSRRQLSPRHPVHYQHPPSQHHSRDSSMLTSPVVAESHHRPSSSKAGSESLAQGGSKTNRRPSKHTRPEGADEVLAHMSQLGINTESESDHEGFEPTSSLYGRPIPERKIRGRVEDEHEVVCAISESGNAKVFGMATIDLTIGQANITKVVGEDGYKTVVETLWRMEHRPQTFLVLKKVLARDRPKLAIKLRQQFPDALLLPVDREFWRESTGLRLIRRYAYRADEPPLRASLENNFYASCAWSAAMGWVERQAPVKFFRHGVHVVYSSPADTMGLDRAAVSALELLQNARGGRAGPTTLFAVLNHTLTPQGRRLLRSAILQPSTDETLLTDRWNAVEELCSNQEFFNAVRAGLQKLQRIDVEQIMSQMGKQLQKPRQEIVTEFAYHPGGTTEVIMASHEVLQGAEKDLNQILMIKAYAQGVQALHDTLEAAGCTSYLCGRATRKSGPYYTMPILNLINEYIQDDAVFSKRPVDIRNNRLWAMKEDADPLMAKSRHEYRRHTSELQEWYEYLCDYFEKHLGCRPKLVLTADNHYRLQFLWTDVEKGVSEEMKRTGLSLPRIKLLAGEDIAFADRKNKQFFCTTKELVILSTRIQAQADVVTQQSDRVVMKLKRALLDDFSRLHMTAEAVATLDMLCSFAQLTTSQTYVRPKIAKSLVLMGARHPVVEMRKKDYVANDIFSGDQELRCTIVTGSNMSGKSTYIKSVALIQILAQIGCFVPATQADMSICDRIFTRLSTEDKPQQNLGTFAVEMTEMSAIIQQATKASMVIIDELGRGTSTVDGIVLAAAMCEELVEKKGPRMFFATHFPEIGDIMNENYREQVLNVHLAAPSDITTLPHKMVNGPVRDRDYGINLARPYLPETVIRNAQTLSRHLESLRGGAGATNPRPATKEEKIQRLIRAVIPTLRQAIDSPMDNEALSRYVSDLQDELRYKLATAKDDEGAISRPLPRITPRRTRRRVPIVPKIATRDEIPQMEHVTKNNEQAKDHQSSGSRPSVRPKPPVLEDIPESERQRWSARCRAAEERTMKNNRKYFRKNKAVAESDPEARKRKERDTADGLVADDGLAKEEMQAKRMRREKREARERNKRFRRSPDENPPSQANVEELKNWYLERARRVGG